MKIFAFFFFAAVAFAQPQLTLSGQGPVNLSLSSSSPGTSDLQFSLTLPLGSTAVLGPDVPAGKMLSCAPSFTTCVIWDFSNRPLSDGVVLVISGPPGTYSVSAALAGTPLLDSVSISTGSPIVVLPPISPCDLNGDGVTDIADAKQLVDSVVNSTRVGNQKALPPSFDINGDGLVNLTDIQRVIDAGQAGGVCKVGQ